MRKGLVVAAGAVVLALFLFCWSSMSRSSGFERFCEEDSDSYEPTEFA